MLDKISKTLLIFDLIGLNVIAGYLVFKSQISNPPFGKFGASKSQINTNFQASNIQTQVQYVDQCGEECQKYIEERIRNQESGITVAPVPTTKATKVKKTRREELLTIPGEGSMSVMNWTDITATNFYFDTKDYPGLVEVYFEANMRLANGNGYGYVRLFDVTNGIAVTGSENNTNSQSSVWTKSQGVYFWAGKNLIRVQAKTLTADTVVYNQGRLRVVTEN